MRRRSLYKKSKGTGGVIMSGNLERFHVSPRFLNELLRYCSSNECIEEVILFGSRARGEHRSNSDIDLAIQTNNATYSKQNLIENEITEMSTYLKLDIVFVDRLTKKGLINNIKREGKIIYEQGKVIRKA